MHLNDFIIADDIRHELGNKISILGIYQDVITLNIPQDMDGAIPLRLGFYIRLRLDSGDAEPTKFEMYLTFNSEELARFEGKILKVEESSVLVLPLIANMLPITQYGVIKFDLKIMNEAELLFETSESIEIRAPK
jgi:hypothetical protein